MPKTRLNRDKRDVLLRLAARAVEATPICPATEKRVKVAQAAYDRAHDDQVTEALAIVAKKVPVSDLKVLAKYKLTKRVGWVRFADLDGGGGVFQVSLFNERKWDRENGAVFLAQHEYGEVQKFRASKMVAEKAAEIVLPVGPKITRSFSNDGAPKEASSKLAKLQVKFVLVFEELRLAERADSDERDSIRRDFIALIESSRTFEDVVEIWSEAKQVTDQIVGSGRDISLVSIDAVERIRNNMESRNIE